MLLQLSRIAAPGDHRTGPLGRVARFGLLLVFGGSLYSILDGSGSARFRNPHILTEPSAWFLHVMMLIVFLVLVSTTAATLLGARFVRRAEIWAVVALVGSGAGAAIVGQLAFGSVWGFPFADLVWWFDVLMLVVGVASTALAMALGTPGCEFGVLRELVACFRRTPASADASRCILGLHALDKWERRHSDRRSAGAGSGR
jgi:hypothetical protein